MYSISILAGSYWRDGQRWLLQSKITDELVTDSQEDVADLFDLVLTPRQQSHKYDCYSFVACHFGHTDTTDTKFVNGACREVPVRGWLRKGEAADDHLTLLSFDIDNADPDRRRLTDRDLDDAIAEIGWKGIGWHTFSSRPDHHKVRLVLFPSRPVTWAEHRAIWALLDHAVFARQSDGSIYDPGDHLYGPTPRGCWRVNWAGGRKVDVDHLLSIELPPEALERAKQAEARPRQKLTSADIERLNEALKKPPHDRYRLDNPLCFDPVWRDDYSRRAVGGSHWGTMRSLLARIVYRHKRYYGYSDQMGFLDLMALAQAIDATGGYYFLNKYGETALAELVALAMQVTPMASTPSVQTLRQSRIFRRT